MRQYNSNNYRSILFWVFINLILIVVLLINEVLITHLLISIIILCLISYISISTQSHNFILYKDKIIIINPWRASENKFMFSDIDNLNIRYNNRVPVLEIYLKNRKYLKYPFEGINYEDREKMINYLKKINTMNVNLIY